MRVFVSALITLAICGGIHSLSQPALAKEPTKPMVQIPFEAERALERGDKTLLSLNQDITRVPSFRVLELPIVDGKIGEHARIDDNAEIYFPFGRIVTVTTEFHKYQPALVASTGIGTTEVAPNPKYQRIQSFDRHLGKVCAVEILPHGEEVEMRLAPNGMMSVVRITPAKYAGPDADNSPSYKVTSGLEMRFLSIKEPLAADLYSKCRSRSAGRSAGQKLTQNTKG
jgi:hypothetical protein